MVELLLNIGPILALLGLGFFTGSYLEGRHFKRLSRREEACRHVFVSQTKTFPGGVSAELTPKLFVAESVIASDYFKSFLSGIRKFFGGEMRSYLSLLERARREAQVRIVEQAAREGYDGVCNLRLETADIGGSLGGKNRVVTVAILASGTAYKRMPAPTG